MVKVQDFTAGNFEENLQHVGERVAEYKEVAETPPETPERQIVKEALKYEPQAAFSSSSQGDDDAGVPRQAQDDKSEEPSFLPNYFLGGDADGMREAVERLAATALHGDLKGSLRQARTLSPYLEDAFHDALVDKVFPEMKKRGLI